MHRSILCGVSGSVWRWDPSLYAGSAAYYVAGRVAYSPQLIEVIVAELGLDGSGALLDVGCGPGSLTLPLAPWFARATGLDADAEMLGEAARQARAAGIINVNWLHRRAEDLPADLGPFRVASLAQSFHWMDRPRVARLLRAALGPGGALVHVHATTHQGLDGDVPLRYPRPPRQQIAALIKDFLGESRRAGHGTLPEMRASEADAGRIEGGIYRAADFVDPTRVEIPGANVVRTADDVVASVFSLSSAAPHLFADRAADFEAALRRLLSETSPDGCFSEQMRETAVDFWRTAT